METQNLKIKTPLPVIYRFDDGKCYQLPYLHPNYLKQVYGVKFAEGLLLSRIYAPPSNWDDADALAQRCGERLMKEVELVKFWNERAKINAAMQIFRQYGIKADNVKSGYHWGWADWKGPWKDSMCCGHLIPRWHADHIDLVRFVLNLK